MGDKASSWWHETNPEQRYVGIGNPHERAKEHELKGRYDPERDHFEVIPMKDDATFDELRQWERDKIAKHRPVHNSSRGGEGRTPGHLRNCSYAHDYDDDDYYDDDDDLGCAYCTNSAALACPHQCCASCCKGCSRHGW